MTWKTGLIVAAAAISLAASPALGIAQASAQCAPGDRIDGSTAQQAEKKFQQAGYANVRDLKKGCDNYWHGVTTMNGSIEHVVLSPEGRVMREGD